MKFYIQTIEQINSEQGVTEYGKTEKYDTENTALVKYYEKLANVSASIEKGVHLYMKISVVNSFGGLVKSDMVGVYQIEETEGDEG